MGLARADDTLARYGLSLPMAQTARVLRSGPDSDTCARISDSVKSRLARRFSDGSPTYDVTYFQAGDKYYAAFSLRQPAAEHLMASGLSFVYVLDSDVEPIEVVAM